MTLDFTLLTEEQRNGNKALEVMKKYGPKNAPTDLAVLQGALMTNKGNRTIDGDLTCYTWSSSFDSANNPRCVSADTSFAVFKKTQRNVGVRPVLPATETSKIQPSAQKTGILGIQIVEYGEYPQIIAPQDISADLEKKFQSQELKTTGKSYTFDSDALTRYERDFYPTEPNKEYEYDGKKYIRINAQPADENSQLSSGEKVQEHQNYWIQVTPIEWLVDETGAWISKKALFAGIQFDKDRSYNSYYIDGEFEKTSLKHYLDAYFSKEIDPSQAPQKSSEKEQKIQKEKNMTGILSEKMIDKIPQIKNQYNPQLFIKEKQK